MFSPEPTSLNSMLDQVWKDYHNGDKEALNNIYEHLMPFCLRVSSKTCGRYITDHDEEASIARLAILEALEKYDPAKGGTPIGMFSVFEICRRILKSCGFSLALNFPYKVEIHINLLGIVFLLPRLTAVMDNDFFNKLPHQFRRQFLNIGVLIHNFQKTVGI